MTLTAWILVIWLVASPFLALALAAVFRWAGR